MGVSVQLLRFIGKAFTDDQYGALIQEDEHIFSFIQG
jgi:hypothetical protein